MGFRVRWSTVSAAASSRLTKKLSSDADGLVSIGWKDASSVG